jgi:iron complex transport system ATP-binding protein
VIVTHHIEEIPVGTTHALLLKDGAIAVSGPVQHVVTSEHISAVFGVEVNVAFDGSRFYARATS